MDLLLTVDVACSQNRASRISKRKTMELLDDYKLRRADEERVKHLLEEATVLRVLKRLGTRAFSVTLRVTAEVLIAMALIELLRS